MIIIQSNLHSLNYDTETFLLFPDFVSNKKRQKVRMRIQKLVAKFAT